MLRGLAACNLLLAGLFAALFAWLTLSPQHVEDTLRDAVVPRLAEDVAGRHPELLRNADWLRLLQSDLVGEGERLVELRAAIRRMFVEAWVAQEVCNQRRCSEPELPLIYDGLWADANAWLNAADVPHVRSFTRERYRQLVSEALLDLRIFTAASAAVLALAALALRLRGPARLLRPLSVALTASSAIGAYGYLFARSWWRTLLFSDFFGYAYLSVVMVVAGYLLLKIFELSPWVSTHESDNR